MSAAETGELLGALSLEGGAEAPSPAPRASHHPPTILVIGMAGSGKTSLVRRLQSHLFAASRPNYVINLDPAVAALPYEPNVDIRDSVNYRNVMKEYGLGPNGAILTSLNLFATRYDQVLGLLGKERDPVLELAIIDTPGQIEAFAWSASGAVISESTAAAAPTAVLFVVDSPRAAAPQAFMSTMLQACSVAYRTRLPIVIALNKADVARPELLLDWMTDVDAFQTALDADTTYAATLSRSLAYVLERFYETLDAVPVSALTGEGIDDLFQSLNSTFEEYEKEYRPHLEARKRKIERLEKKRREADARAFREDRESDLRKAGAVAGTRGSARGGLGAVQEEADERD